MLQVSGVTKAFKAQPDTVVALNGVDLEVAKGSFTAVLGASGSGKTTLLRVLAGFERPDSGEVRLDGELVAGDGTYIPSERRNVGIVAQDGALFPHLDVAANIAYGLDRGWALWHSRSRKLERAERVRELLALVGLPGYGSRRVDELSGGQQQRVALARALAPEPSVILLDEPFSALDAGLRVEVREEVRDLLARLGTTAVLVTHDQSEALSMADHVAIMREGRVVQDGSPSDVYLHPADAPLAEFLGDAVVLSAEVRVAGVQDAGAGSTNRIVRELATVPAGPASSDHPGVATGMVVAPTVTCPLGELRIQDGVDVHSGDSCTVVLRPEQLELCEVGVDASVCATSFYGHDGLVTLAVDGVDSAVTVRMVGSLLPRIGEQVHVRVVPGSVAHVAS